MNLTVSGKIIANLFIARACAVLILCLGGSTALTQNAMAAAKKPPVNGAAAIPEPTGVKLFQLTRTNTVNNAYEELTIRPELATLVQSGGRLNKSIALTPEFTAEVEKRIAAMAPLKQKPVSRKDNIRIEITIKPTDGHERIEIAPTGEHGALYVEMMDLRNRILNDAK